MATAKKTRTTTKTRTVNFLDEFIGLIDSIILDTFNRENLNESLVSTNEKGVGYRPRLFHMLETFAKVQQTGFKTLDQIDNTYRQLCELEHLDITNPNAKTRLKWTNRWIKKADKESRQKVPQAVTQMFTDFRSCFKSTKEGGLITKPKFLPTEIRKDGTQSKAKRDRPQEFDIFGKFNSYQDMLKALNESREKLKDPEIEDLKSMSRYALSYIYKNPTRVKSFNLGFIALCAELDIPISAPIKETKNKRTKKITARNKKSKEK